MAVLVIPVLAVGLFFFLLGVIGMIRLPDAYCRMHATTKCDTLGSGLVLVALMLYDGLTPTSLKLFLLIVFIWLTNPTAAHVIARAAYRSGDVPFCVGSCSLDRTEGGQVQ